MRYEILKNLGIILEEIDQEEKRKNDFIINARINDYHAEDSSETVKSEADDDDDNDDQANDDRKNSESEPQDEELSTPDESPSTINLADALDYNNLKEDLNLFRASRSLSDKEVDEELYKYFNRLTDSEKKILHVFIKGLTQVTLLKVSGKTAYIPTDLKFNVSKKGVASSEKIKSKQRIQSLEKDKAEDAANMPIKIGENIDLAKQKIINLVKENNE